jgi:PEGA domain-containing protein
MTRTLAFTWPAIIATALCVGSAAAQDNRDAGSQSNGGGGAAAAAPAPAPAPRPAPAQSGASSGSGGGRTATRSGSGESQGSGSGGSGHAVARGERDWITGRSDSQTRPRGEATQPAGERPAGGGRTRTTGSTGSTSTDGSSVPSYSRPREGRPATGEAVERRPSGGVSPPIYIDGGYYPYYPWGWGGLGYGAYYGGYYDPWYDPWAYGGSYPSSSSYGYEGALRLKVKPREAAVYVDGYYAGEVDEFDGVFQRLHIDSGPHRIEITLDGYEPLNFDVRIQPDKTVTYKSEMKRLP